jgi:mono/diheme cytochrome c family protein
MRSSGPENRQQARGERGGFAPGYVMVLIAGVAGMALIGGQSWRVDADALASTPDAVPAADTRSGAPAVAVAVRLPLHSIGTNPSVPDVQALVNTYCVTCHNEVSAVAGMVLDTVDATQPGNNPQIWEKVITKLRAGTMPPAGMPRPEIAAYEEAAAWLEGELDRAWLASPNPGRINGIHRLNRMEYNNAIRDLLALDVDVRELLPGDETADGGFDNMAGTLTISTAHMERYLSVARQLTRMAVGLPPANADYHVFRVNELLQQTDLMNEELPLGSRGGMAVPYHFPADGEYTIKVKLTTNYAEYIRGMGWPQLIDFRIDGKLVKRVSVGGEAAAYRPAASTYEGAGQPGFQGDWEWEAYMQGGATEPLEVRTFVPGGPHTVGVSFPMYMWESELRFFPQPPVREWGRTGKYNTYYMGYAGVNEVMISGPYEVAGPALDTPSRRAIFTCEPKAPSEEEECASQVLERMARRAYRRPVVPADMATLMEFFRQGLTDGGSFDTGIQFALERLLVDPDFLLRVYRDPPSRVLPEQQDGNGSSAAAAGDVYPLSDLEVASRISFFLWSSIPDETLLQLAEQKRLKEPAVLREQVRRMLADPRAAQALTVGFADQWLNVRVLEEKVADEVLHPLFDHNLLEAFQLETEMFVASTIEEDKSILDLLNADYTFVNERLARHYNIPDVYGSRMRRVKLPDMEQRGGLLAHGGLLALTAYPNRTSPVIRGKWLLDNILGSPVPNPPANVNASLAEGGAAQAATIRERLAQHRNNPVCATCHATMDPLGFALESFDATGAWRTVDEKGLPVDNIGTWPSGLEIKGFTGLRSMLLDKREMFVRNLTEKLMTYALGRRVEYFDRPTVRKIARDAEAANYTWSSIITGIVESPAFLMRAPATD